MSQSKDEWLRSLGLGTNSSGGGGGGSPGRPAGGPPAPTLDTSGARSDSLILSWRWPSAPRGTQFELCYREAQGGPWRSQKLPPGETAASGQQLRGLSSNTTYSIAVQTAGNPSSRGAELKATTAPAIPTGLEALGATDSSISMRWRPAPGTGVRYAVYGSASLNFAKVYSGVEPSCEVTGLSRGKEYGFRVCAMNAFGGASDFSPELLMRCEPSSIAGARSGAASARGGAITAELLTLTHDSLSMRWSPPPGGTASNYIVELAEAEDGVVADDEEWAVIYEGVPPGCEISYLAPSTECAPPPPPRAPAPPRPRAPFPLASANWPTPVAGRGWRVGAQCTLSKLPARAHQRAHRSATARSVSGALLRHPLPGRPHPRGLHRRPRCHFRFRRATRRAYAR